MDSSALLKNTFDTMYLISTVLNSECPDCEFVKAMDIAGIYKICKFHSLQSIVYAAIDSLLVKDADFVLELPEYIHKDWKSMRKRIIRKDLAFDFEREKILSFMEENGIWYLPMKGIYLRKFYPQMGLRYLADNDILFDEKYRKTVRSFMVERGYTVQSYGKGAHDVYTKDPFYNFEMHVGLYRGTGGDPRRIKLSEYYESIFEKLIKDPDKNFSYHMTDEDFYILLVTHAYKHHVCGGTGLRTFVDFYVFLSKMGEKLNWDYIRSELSKMDLVDYEKLIRSISEKLFSKECVNLNRDDSVLSCEEEDTVLLYARSGTYGVKSRQMEESLSKYRNKSGKITASSKIKYCFRRVVPEMRYYKENAEFVYKHKILIPGFLVGRAFKAVFVKRNIKRELNQIKKVKTEKKGP